MFLVTMKLIRHIFSAVSVCSNPCVGPFPRIKMSFFLLLTWTEELISTSTPKIILFWPNPPFGNEKFEFLSNPIP